jgi:hypothetical protein
MDALSRHPRRLLNAVATGELTAERLDLPRMASNHHQAGVVAPEAVLTVRTSTVAEGSR